MFSLISNSPLSDVLAPKLSPIEEFIYQWDSFTTFFSQEGNENKELCKCLIESTNLSSKLSKMSDILIEEQANYISENEGALCLSMEYVLQNKVLETLSVLAQAETPLGICPRIMLFFNRLLNECKADLIPHKCVYSSLNKLIIICGRIPAGPYESIEMLFLNGLTEKIYRNPLFLNFFLDNSFPLINSLLCLLCSPDSEISKRAGDSIIKLVYLTDENAQQIICQKTPFCSKIISQIINYYNEIPRSLNPQEVEIAIYTFRNDSACHSSFTNSVRKFLCFLKWYIFFDMLIYHSPKDCLLIKTLLSQFKLEFLESCILPDLSGDGFKEEFDAIDNSFLTTVLLSNCLRNTESYILFNCISEFLTIPDQINPNIPSKHKNCQLFQILLKRCSLSQVQFNDDNYKSETVKLASATLQLFEDILMRPSRNVIDCLIVNHIKKCSCLETKEKDENWENFDSVMGKIDMRDLFVEIQTISKEICKLPNISTVSTIEPAKLNAILYYFASLIPSELKFNFENEADDYMAYLKEAIKGEQIFLTSCYAHWPEKQVARTDYLSELDNQGVFVKMIFDNLNSMFSLPYDINLQIFSLIAKLSLIPDENINEYMLNPTVTLNASSQNLFGILYKLVEELQISVKGISDLQQQLCNTKKSLLREEVDQVDKNYTENDEICNILQSLIVLDEFCKELISIIFIKNQIIACCKEQL